MAKKVLALLLALIMTLSLCPLSAFADEEDAGLITDAATEDVQLPEEAEAKNEEDGQGDEALLSGELLNELYQQEIALNEPEETKYLYSSSTSLSQKNLYAAIKPILGLEDSGTVYLNGGKLKNQTVKSSTILGSVSLQHRVEYSVATSKDGDPIGWFTFFNTASTISQSVSPIRVTEPATLDEAERRADFTAQILQYLSVSTADGELTDAVITLPGLDSLNTTTDVWGKTLSISASFAGLGPYASSSKDIKVEFGDPRQETALALKNSTYEGSLYALTLMNVDELRQLVFEYLVDTENCTENVKALSDLLTIEVKSGSRWYALDTANWNVSGTLTIRFTYNGSAEWKPTEAKQADLTLVDTRVDAGLVFFEEPEISYNFSEGLPLNQNALVRLVFNALVDRENSEHTDLSFSNLTIEYLAHKKTGILDSDKWAMLDDPGTSSGYHKFGDQTTEQVRLTFNGDENYKPLAKTLEFTLTLSDLRTPFALKAKEPCSYNYYPGFHDGKSLDEINSAIVNAIVANSSVQLVSGGKLNDKASVEFKSGKNYVTLDDAAFGKNATETIRISYAGDKTYQEYSGEFTLAIVDPRMEAEIVVGQSFTLIKGSSYEATLNAIVVKGSDGKTIANPAMDYSKSGLDGLAVGEHTIIVSFKGNDSYKPAEGEVTVKVTDPGEDRYYVTLVIEGTDKGTVKLDPSFSVSEGVYGVYAYNGFTVVASPKKGNYTVSIAVVDQNGKQVASSGLLNNTLTVDPPADNSGKITGTYTVTVTFESIDLKLNDEVVLPYYWIRKADGSYNDVFTGMLFNAVYNNESKPALTLDDVTITFMADLLGLVWKPLDYEKDGLLEIANHNFGTKGIDSTEKVRVSATINGNKVEKTVTVSFEDTRKATTMTCSDVTALYSNLNSVIASRAKIVDEDGNAVKADPSEIAFSAVKADLTGAQEVTVTYLGNGDYCPSECTIKVYVLYGLAKLNVRSKIVTYDPNRSLADANAIVSSMFTVEPADLDYLTLIYGIDSTATGFVSFDIPKSLQEKMNILGFIDIYGLLKSWMGDGVDLDGFRDVLHKLADALESSSGGQSAAESIGFNPEALSQLLSILENIPSIMDMKITLGNAPTNAGLYSVNAICTDLNYALSVGVGTLTILPASSGVQLAFRENTVLKKKMTSTLLLKLPISTTYEVAYEEFISPRFDSVCGGKLSYNGVEQKNVELTYTYTGVADDLSPTILDCKGKPTKSGTYIQTISAGSNYQVLPITRVIKVLPGDVEITADSKQTVTYDGKPHAVSYKAVYNELGQPEVPAEEMTVTYKQASKGLINGLLNAFSKGSTTAPSAAGTYEVTIAYNGNASARKTVTLVIQK